MNFLVRDNNFSHNYLLQLKICKLLHRYNSFRYVQLITLGSSHMFLTVCNIATDYQLQAMCM